MKKLLFVSAIILTIIGCASKSGYNYSQDIVAKERSLTPDIERTEDSMSNWIVTGKYDSMAAIGKRMEDLVQSKIDEIEKMPLPDAKKASEFKASVMKYFGFIKGLYTKYKNLGLAATDEDREAVLNEIRDFVNKKAGYIGDMQRAQKEYAEANGFKVEK